MFVVTMAHRSLPQQPQAQLQLEPCAAAGSRLETSLCAGVATGCARPAGVFHLYVRQTAGFVVAHGLLNRLFPKGSIRWGDCTTLADAGTARMLAMVADSRKPPPASPAPAQLLPLPAPVRTARWVGLVALRDPVERLVAQFFQSFPLKEWGHERALHSLDGGAHLAAWVDRHSARPPRRGNDGKAHLTFELDNVYIKVLRTRRHRKPMFIPRRLPPLPQPASLTLAAFRRAHLLRVRFSRGLTAPRRWTASRSNGPCVSSRCPPGALAASTPTRPTSLPPYPPMSLGAATFDAGFNFISLRGFPAVRVRSGADRRVA